MWRWDNWWNCTSVKTAEVLVACISGYPPFYSINLFTSVPKFFETKSSRWIYEDSPLSIIVSLNPCVPGAKKRCRIPFPSLAWNVGAIRYWSLPVTRLEKRICRNQPGSVSVPNSDRWWKAGLYATEEFWKEGGFGIELRRWVGLVDYWGDVRLFSWHAVLIGIVPRSP